MKNTEGKVRIICVGSLRNEALAYRREPELFMEKIEVIVAEKNKTKLSFMGKKILGMKT